MKSINKITDDATQRAFLIGNPGQRITMELRYLPSQQEWIMDLRYLTFALCGMIVVPSPNMLRQYKNIIPFGMACVTTDGLEIFYADDFVTNRAQLILLTAAAVIAIEEKYKNA